MVSAPAAGVRRWRLRAAAALSVLATVLAAAGCADTGASGILELKLGHVSSPGSLGALSADEFARRVNEELAGRVNISVFGSSQLGSDEVLMVKLRLGTVDFAAPSTVMSSTVEEFGFFEMPYLVKDRPHMKRVEEAVYWPHLEPAANARGYKTLALWENGFRHITNNRRPIVTPADLSGIKLRTPKGHWRVVLFQSYGAHPSPMSLGEVFVALQTGVIDGQENPLQQIYASRFQEVQRYLSLTNHVYSPAFLIAGAEKWATHPPDIRAAIERIARETQDYVYETAEQMDREMLSLFEEAGMAINETDRAAFVAASQRVYDLFGRDVPESREWIRTALALADETPASAADPSQPQ